MDISGKKLKGVMLKMNFASIRNMDISDGEGIGVALYTQGCP